jgi:hypothetical protein
VTDEQRKNERARRRRDRRLNLSALERLEQQAKRQLRRQDTWIAREATKQAAWEGMA